MYPALPQRSQDYHPKGHRLPEIHKPKKREEKKGPRRDMGDLSLGPYWLHSCLQWHPFPALLSAFLGGNSGISIVGRLGKSHTPVWVVKAATQTR